MRAPEPMHGKLSQIHHDGTGVFHRLPNPLKATRYHSLIVDRAGLPEALYVNAWTEDVIAWRASPIASGRLRSGGCQFHPESIASVAGHSLLKNFLDIAAAAAALARDFS